jgi:glycosyltransferase involved in cell wall biosynthesis
MTNQPKLSIIIPAYREERSIRQTVERIVEVYDRLPYSYEVLVVVDGSPDETAAEAKKVNSQNVKVYEYSPNQGKGYAIKYGVEKAIGKIVTFTDAGGDFNPEQFDKYVSLMELFDADIVIGSKRHPASRVNYPLVRRIYSRCYQLLIRLLFGLKVTDTQTGLKFFKSNVAKTIFPKALVKQYAIDLELLVIAQQYGFKRIFEAPVELEFNTEGGGAATIRAIWKMFVDTLAVFYRSRILNYYQQSNQDK